MIPIAILPRSRQCRQTEQLAPCAATSSTPLIASDHHNALLKRWRVVGSRLGVVFSDRGPWELGPVQAIRGRICGVRADHLPPLALWHTYRAIEEHRDA